VSDTHLIGLDWGTTQLRAYRFVAGGQVAESRQLPAGILRVPDGFDRAFEDACGDWRTASPAAPILACGMIGSAQGWREAPYLDVPTGLDALGRALTEVSTRSGATLHIIPGLIARGKLPAVIGQESLLGITGQEPLLRLIESQPLPEVMRGEETQVAGALGDAAAPTGASTWIALPGSHTKWVRVRDRHIVQFHTFMTGEVFAALRDHTILGRTMEHPAGPHDGAFDRGVEVARSPRGSVGALSTIFSTRTLGLVGALPSASQPDYLSGLLIGHELAGLGFLGEHPDPILLVGSDELCRRYRRALAAFGRATAIASGATERGLWRVAVSAGLVSTSGPR
jgi:2-dehydro-3-deoxygalactonokinase